MPSSYQAPSRKDKIQEKTHSQTPVTNASTETATVGKILESKGKDVFSLRPQNTLHEAVVQLKEKRIGALIVKDAAGKLQGILSERDIVRRLAETPGQTLSQKVEDIMTRDVKTCSPGDQLISVLQTMTKGKFRHMPVVNGDIVVGIVTIGDVVNYRLQELEYESLQLKQLIVG
ncbi:CBS domain-containing protein [Roseibium alexandrii]|uniref:Putative signal-transduction protein n=1 Tax=Roseibium alexandrii (strain DSM 17067 / NCIMB 14079 / DFL-11) TaxID=244592 RepID=A0A5E8H8G3_ROSAD|nr:CBS domain-containing protein [Roseibium alexandrii]EEE47694.2 putative signal-transduction protein [Roseibium alexandrii DFL-11]